MLFDFTTLALPINVAIFVAAAGVVWVAGSRLAGYADDIAQRTGLSYALLGMLMLGGITSLPEIAVTVTAGVSGDAALAVNNLFGGVALQVVVIAIGDAALRKRALTHVTGSPVVLLQGVFCCLALAMCVCAIAIGDTAILGVGVWSGAIFGACIGLLWLISRYRGDQAWKPAEPIEIEEAEADPPRPLGRAVVLTVVVGAAIVVAGFLLARTGEALAEQTGLGSSFTGTVFVGLSTSLPEISTVLAAVRLRRYLMAFSDIFGTNIIDIALIFVVDLSFSGGPVLNEVGSYSIVAASLAAVVTLIYVSGLIERRDKQVAGLGYDSWAVVLAYGGGIALLYTLRGGS